MVPPASHKVSRVSWYSGYCRCLPLSNTRLSLSLAGFPKTLLLASSSLLQSTTPVRTRSGLGSFPFARRYSGNRFSFSSSGYLDVSVPRVPFHTLWIGVWMTEVGSARFPHSEIHGSLDICSFPWLIAACHVFLRLLVPRHPPCALISLTCRRSFLLC